MESKHPLLDCALALIGAGNMAEALLKGLLTATPVRPGAIRVNNRGNGDRLEELAQRYGVLVTGTKAEALGGADLVVLAVKPQDIDAAMAQVRPHLQPQQLVISVAAGIRLSRLKRGLGGHQLLIRAMPNTSCSVLQGAIGLAYSAAVSDPGRARARALFAAVGEVVDVDEDLLDAVTGLSGSGPAYVYLLAEALAAAGEDAGLPADVAERLAVQTVIGAGRMLEQGEDPRKLRLQVMSPGGTTVAGIKAMLDGGFADAIAAGVERATARSRELAGGSESDEAVREPGA